MKVTADCFCDGNLYGGSLEGRTAAQHRVEDRPGCEHIRRGRPMSGENHLRTHVADRPAHAIGGRESFPPDEIFQQRVHAL